MMDNNNNNNNTERESATFVNNNSINNQNNVDSVSNSYINTPHNNNKTNTETNSTKTPQPTPSKTANNGSNTKTESTKSNNNNNDKQNGDNKSTTKVITPTNVDDEKQIHQTKDNNEESSIKLSEVDNLRLYKANSGYYRSRTIIKSNNNNSNNISIKFIKCNKIKHGIKGNQLIPYQSELHNESGTNQCKWYLSGMVKSPGSKMLQIYKKNGWILVLEILQSSGSMSISKVKKFKDIIEKEQEPKDRIKTRIKKKGEYSKRKWKKRHSRKGKPEKVYTYKTLERVNVQHFGSDPDKLPTEGVIKVTFNIGNDEETYDTYGDAKI